MLIDCHHACPKWHMCKEYSINCFNPTAFHMTSIWIMALTLPSAPNFPLVSPWLWLPQACWLFTAYSLEPALSLCMNRSMQFILFPCSPLCVWDSVVMKWGKIIHADCCKLPLCGIPSSVQLLWSVFAFCTSQTVILWTHFSKCMYIFCGTTLQITI